MTISDRFASIYLVANAEDHKLSNINVFLVSGKRCVGKDFICDLFVETLGNEFNLHCCKLSHSYFVKRLYCDRTGTNLNQLLTDRSYKEKHRNSMIELARTEQEYNPDILSDYVYAEIQRLHSIAPLDCVFISDFRRTFEETYFQKRFKRVFSFRINASDDVRSARGWTYDPFKDERYTECELDDKRDWDSIFVNDGTVADVKRWIYQQAKTIFDL